MKGLSKFARFIALAAILAVVLIAGSSGMRQASAAPPAGGSVAITSPTNGAGVNGTIRISGTYASLYRVVIAFNAGVIEDVHMEDPNGDNTGTWYYDWNPAGYSGNVEITVRGFSTDDRYFRWAAPVNVTVNQPQYQPPAVSFVSPAEGSTASGTTPITVSASDVQGLASVEVRVDWGTWQPATPSGGSYIYNWNTTGLGNKTHAVEARATDTNGNITKTATRYIKTGTGTSEPSIVKHSDRAIWVWEPATYQLLESPGSRDALAQFLDDPSLSTQTRKTIYLYADRYDGAYYLTEHPEYYRSFIAWAHTRGYHVHALLGSSFYVAPFYAYSRYHTKAVELMENVINYNISSAANEQFDGVNIDIEPHGLADWVPAKPAIQLNYLDMLDKMMQREAASGSGLYTGPAIPRSFDLNTEDKSINWHGSTKWLAYHVQDITDYVSIMDYRDVAAGPSGIIDHAAGEINYANGIGKKVAIGVETDWIAPTGDPEKISFSEEGRLWMETELGLVYSAYNSSPSFLGVAVHHYDSYRVLPSKWRPSGTFWSPTGTDTTAPSTPSGLTAAAWDWQRIDLHWNRSTDNGLVDYYEVHRSTTNNFTPSAATLVRKAGFNFVKDWGLLANTTYYYKIIAVDVKGNKSTVSSQVSAATPVGIGLIPIHIDSITINTSGNLPSATIRIVNSNGTPVSGINVFGSFGGAAGKSFSGNTGSSGTYTVSSETFEDTANYIVQFAPEKIMGNGYYWAYSLDVVHVGTGSKGN